MASRPITTKYDARCMPFPWQAFYGEYDLGDPIGIGEDEESAIADLKQAAEMEV